MSINLKCADPHRATVELLCQFRFIQLFFEGFTLFLQTFCYMTRWVSLYMLWTV